MGLGFVQRCHATVACLAANMTVRRDISTRRERKKRGGTGKTRKRGLHQCQYPRTKIYASNSQSWGAAGEDGDGNDE